MVPTHPPHSNDTTNGPPQSNDKTSERFPMATTRPANGTTAVKQPASERFPTASGQAGFQCWSAPDKPFNHCGPIPHRTPSVMDIGEPFSVASHRRAATLLAQSKQQQPQQQARRRQPPQPPHSTRSPPPPPPSPPTPLPHPLPLRRPSSHHRSLSRLHPATDAGAASPLARQQLLSPFSSGMG